MELIMIATNLVQTAVLAVLLFLSIRLLLKNTNSLTAVFLSFFFALWFLADIYWLVYDILRADARMPFAANEFAEAALVLTLAAILNSAVPHGSHAAVRQVVFGALFAVCNVVLWIAWSGEWVQDIITGLAFIWLISSVACTLKVVHALSKKEWILLGAFCALLIAGQGLTFFFEDPVKSGIDAGCYLLLFLVILYWLVKLIVSYKRKDSSKRLASLAVANYVWIVVTLFMSSGIIYTVIFNVETITGVLVFLAAAKVVKES